MVRGVESYATGMYGVLSAIEAGHLSERDRFGRSDSLSNADDDLARALVETGHETLIQMILMDADFKAFDEVVHAYLKNGQLGKVVETLMAYPKRRSRLDKDDFLKALLDASIEDQVILDFVAYISPDGNEIPGISSDHYYYVRYFIPQLWEKGRDELAQMIVSEYISENEQPFFAVLHRLNQGEEIDPQEIATVFDVYCPFEELDEDTRWTRYRESQIRTKVVEFFLCTLDKMEVDFHVLEMSLLAHKARVKTQQMESRRSWTTVTESKVLQGYLGDLDFDGADVFAEAFGSGKEIVSEARMDHVLKSGSLEEHAHALGISLGIKDEQIGEIKKETGEEDAAMIPAQGEWHQRVRYYQLCAQQAADRALFELRHGTPKAAQVCIDEMIATVDLIGVPPVEDCPIQHKKTLRTHKLKQKRALREQFLRVGLLEVLPRKDGWSDKMGATDAERAFSRANSEGGRRGGSSRYEIDAGYYERQAAQELEKQASIREALNESPQKAISLLKEQVNYRSNEEDWNRGRLILEAAPDQFKAIVEMLSNDYFERSYHYDWNRNPHEALARFYVFARGLGVITDVEWNELFDQWDRARYCPDNTRDMPHDAVVAMVEGLLAQDAPGDAMKYLNVLEKAEKEGESKLERRTLMICLALLVRYGSSRVDEGSSGVEAAFRGGTLSEDASRQQQIEYWNTKVECAAALKDEDGYGESYSELLKFLDDPMMIREFTRLMAFGSLRSTHQKKDVLMGAHGFHKESQRARWRIVHSMIDHRIPGVEAMGEIKSKETPPRVALLFFRKLVQTGVLHRHTSAYLTEEDLPYLRRILAQHQNQFNTVMDTIEKDLAKSRDHNKPRRLEVMHWPNVLKLLGSIGVITPGIYAEAKSLQFDSREMEKLGERVEELKKGIFSNTPIDSATTSALLAELIWIAYQPANMGLSDVERLCEKISDCSHHLDRYNFPEDGYDLDLLTTRTMHLRRGSDVRTPSVIHERKTLAELEEPTGTAGLKQVVPGRATVRQLCALGRLKLSNVELRDVLDVFEEDMFMQGALTDWRRARTDDARYRALRRLQEALGVYSEDNLEARVFAYLRKYRKTTSEMVTGLVKSLKKPGRRRAIEQQLGMEMDDSKSDRKIAAAIISKVVLKKFKPLAQMRRLISSDVKNFVTDDGEEVSSSDVRLRAVISKNKASFFAKASAGICTSGEIDLFERPDHFHINLVDDRTQTCVGNVQAYIMTHKGQPYLLLRGFNPSTKLLKEVDVESLCEAIIGVGRQFVRENGLSGLMLSEQGGFLSLSNRPDVTHYLENAYKDNVVDIEAFKIARSGRVEIRKAYLVEERSSGKVPRRRAVDGSFYPQESMVA